MLSNLDHLNLPHFAYKLSERNGKDYIWDVVRRMWVHFTPEEWVRQHVVHMLMGKYSYPVGLMRTEGGFDSFMMKKRSDILVLGRRGEPFILVECKRPQVPLDDNVMRQVGLYNQILKAQYVLVTNGLEHYVIEYKDRSFEFIDDVPHYAEVWTD